MSEDSSEKAQMLLPMAAKDVMNKIVITLDENTNVKRAAQIMALEGASAIIITSEGKAAGIITERDILKRIVAEDKNSIKTKAKDIMSSPLVTIGPNVDLEEAAHIMFEKKVKNLPVIDDGHLIGLVKLQDICRLQPEILKILRKIMNTPENIQRVLKCYIS